MSVAKQQFNLLQSQLHSGFKIIGIPERGNAGEFYFKLRGFEQGTSKPLDYVIGVPDGTDISAFSHKLSAATETEEKRYLRRDLTKGFVLMDVVGYSKMTLDEQLGLLSRVQAMLRNGTGEQFQESVEGFIPTGDGCFVVFNENGLSRMMMFARWLRTTIEEYNTLELSTIRIAVRVAAHIGTVDYYRDLHDGWNYIGPGINQTARIMEAKPDPGEVFVSPEVAIKNANYPATLSEAVTYKDKHGIEHRYQKVITWG